MINKLFNNVKRMSLIIFLEALKIKRNNILFSKAKSLKEFRLIIID